MSRTYRPPFTVAAGIVSQVAAIAESLGRLGAVQGKALRLRRINRIRSVRGSLAIEGNTLSEAQITAILDGKPVIAPPREVLEARNALAAYEGLPRWKPAHEPHLLAAHACLMTGLADDAGHYRRGGVGVMQGQQMVHMAPPASRVPTLMKNLLRWLADTDQHPLIASSVFHYEFEFIHPFSDGNGRMGRLWQTLILSRWNPLFAHVPVESLVHAQQAGYYAALNESTQRSDCGVFVEFMLAAIADSLHEATSAETPVETPADVSVEKAVRTPDLLLALLRRQPELTLAEVARALGKSVRTVERAAAQLQAQNRLRFEGPKKGGQWRVL